MSTYSLASYAGMLGDGTRIAAYVEALERSVRPGSVVLDLGAGFGYFALLACRLGAARVYAIEPAESLNLLPELARINGFEGRVVALKDLSTRVTLPERADVIVADIRGTLPMLSGSLRTMIDARDRLLAPGGTLIPWRDRLQVAPVDDRAMWASAVTPWLRGNRTFELARGLKLEPVERLLAQTARSQEIQHRSLVAPAQTWAEIDYHTNTQSNVEGTVEFTVAQAGVLHGFALWFEAELMSGIHYSTGPGHMPTVYGTRFLPLLEPLPVQDGDRLFVNVASTDIQGEYHMSWRTKLVREGKIAKSFEQGDFLAEPLSLERLKQRLPGYVPELKHEGLVAQLVLEGVQAGRTLGQIASTLVEKFPQRFETIAGALDHAAKTIERING